MKARLTVAEAAEHFGVSPATVRRRCADGSLQAEKVGRDWVISTVAPSAASPIEDYVWCTECQEPHGFHEGCLSLVGEDLESMPCQHNRRLRVETLPENWDRTYEAFPIYDYFVRPAKRLGYDLFEKAPVVDPAVHRPMYFLEET